MLRGYQARIAASALSRNTIVMLPTGTGKTLIAAEVIKSLGPRSVFFVPTILLVQQQASAIRTWTGLRVAEYYGGQHMDLGFEALVSTPKAFEAAQARDPAGLLAWSTFRLVAFDEVHHVLKDHPYRKLVASMRRSGYSGRILGLSASLTYAVDRAGVEAAVGRLCHELGEAFVEVATAAEMEADGFCGGAPAPAEVDLLDIPADGSACGVLPSEDRKPHLLLPTFLSRAASGHATPFAAALLGVVRSMEGAVCDYFASPISGPGAKPLRDWGEAAHALAPRQPRFAQLEHYYEALRLLVVSWEVAMDAAVTYLRMFGAHEPRCLCEWPQEVQDALSAFWSGAPATFPRFEHLCEVLEAKLDATATFRGIVFVEQRAMTHILAHVIAGCPTLVARLRTACLYATSSPATASLRVTPAEARARVGDFATGRVNLLLATVVAEEGMDVPAANCVIRFDPMVHSVSYVQGRGRARAEDSTYVVLAERADRPAALLAEVERQQLALIGAMRTTGEDTRREWEARERVAQASREQSAAAVLSGSHAASGTLALLNLYCSKTKVVLEESRLVDAREHVVEMGYTSCLRSVRAVGRASSVKEARQLAAADLVAALVGAPVAGKVA